MTRQPSLVTLVVVPCMAGAITIFALCCAIGLQWLALQSIAWTAMIVDYSKNASLCQAIVKTLDGAHPCSLCRVVNKAKAAEKKSGLQAFTPKFDIILTKRVIRLVRPFIDFDYANRDFRISEVGHSPLLPPPRSIMS